MSDAEKPRGAGAVAREADTAMKLPESIQVIERSWLSSKQHRACMHAPAQWFVDSGYGAHVPQTLALLERVLAGKKLARLVNTHCHSDHMGGQRRDPGEIRLQDEHSGRRGGAHR